MGNYATNAAVALRLPGRTLSVSSTPSTTTVDAWIDEAEAELDGALAAAGFTVPVTAARGVSICKAKVVSYAVGRWKAGVSAGTDLEDADETAEMKEFRDFIALIQEDPNRVAAMLNHASGSSGGPSVLRSYATDNSDGKSVGAGDFDPVFTRDGKW